MSARFQSFSANARVIGQFMLSFIHCTAQDEVLPYLRRHNMTDIDPKAWYPLQKWLDVLNDIDERSGNAMFDFVSIGMKMSQRAILPSEFDSLSFEDVLLSLDEAYQKNHRGDVGEIVVTEQRDGFIKVNERTPYPDDLIYGLLYGFVQRFQPVGINATVSFEDVARRDRKGKTTVLFIEWGPVDESTFGNGSRELQRPER